MLGVLRRASGHHLSEVEEVTVCREEYLTCLDLMLDNCDWSSRLKVQKSFTSLSHTFDLNCGKIQRALGDHQVTLGQSFPSLLYQAILSLCTWIIRAYRLQFSRYGYLVNFI